MKHVVSFSGGLGSWMAAKRVAEMYGTDDLYLVFTDVLIEDEDLYRFLPEAANNVGGKLIWIKDGRDPWDVFREKRYMGNTRTAHCSEELKSKPFYAWVDDLIEKYPDEKVIIYLGIDWTESHRLDNARTRRPEYTIEAPLCEKPLLSKQQIRHELAASGIALPRLYQMGFSHNNCSGGCVKAGQGQWARLYAENAARYEEFENRQEILMKDIPTLRPFLRITIDGVLHYLTLKEFRKRLEANAQIDMYDIGGCGCFLD
jgi:3'-phosphoadenosine 5'-phosphosulfate sulfotransferase (PAPS reductase)/FAD synthetase